MHVQLTTAGQAESLGFSPALHVQYAIADQGLCGASREAAPLGRMQDTNTRYGPSHGNASRDRGGVFDFGKFRHRERCVADCWGLSCLLVLGAGVLVSVEIWFLSRLTSHVRFLNRRRSEQNLH
jgi:hypothetical protein